MNKVDISVILPVYNESECIEDVISELVQALSEIESITSYEIIAVNDGSTDNTCEKLLEMAKTIQCLVVLDTVTNMGQSAALGMGIKAAAGALICTIDADGQNNPYDIKNCIKAMRDESADACCGWRKNRHDVKSKKIGSRLANSIRRAVLKDGVIDTGCSMRVIKAEFLKSLQIWNGMHRFLPALVKMQHGTIAQIPVDHRDRKTGKSNYTNWARLKKTILDLFGVWWMKKRIVVYKK